MSVNNITLVSALFLLTIAGLSGTQRSVAATASADDPQAAEQPVQPEKIIPPERTRFRALLLANPNYFGNVKGSPLKAVKAQKLDTAYEELTCVGFNPQFDLLHAVVLVKQPAGYLGGLCSAGSPEYVRFYLSFDDGAHWEDQGVTSFTAHDLPGEKPLEYAVTLQAHPSKRICTFPNLPRVRAILSWNDLPPADEPDHAPVWGNVEEAQIQIGTRLLFKNVPELLEGLKLQLPAPFPPLMNPQEPVELVEPPLPSGAELHALYKGAKVEPHRYLYKELQPLIDASALGQPAILKPLLTLPDIDWKDVLGGLYKTNGDTRYEELGCVGFDTRVSNLIGVITIKLPNGYLSGLCGSGSTEYVAFWIDWGTGGWTYAGTTSVRVHDVAALPKEGLKYSVFQPIDASARRRPCVNGPVFARVRAILSWEAPPPPENPDYVPHWGNRHETRIHVPPGAPAGGEPAAYIETVAGMSVVDISPVTGLATGSAVTAGFAANQSPFGGLVVISGHIAPAPDISNGAGHLQYMIEAKQPDGSWGPLIATFGIQRSQLLNGVWSNLPAHTQTSSDGWYDYEEDLAFGPGNALITVAGNTLMMWPTGGLNGERLLRITAKLGANDYFGSQVIKVWLDNTAPGATIGITSGGGDCADFAVDSTVDGTYSAADEHFGGLTFSLLPAKGGSFTAPSPYPPDGTMPLVREFGAAPGVPTFGESGVWKFNTAGLPPCGYVIQIDVWDRTIVHSGSIGWHHPEVVGLCVRKQP